MIGPQWCSIKSSAGARRLDDPNDFVRLEIASALGRNIAVIPVLVHDAKMPRPEDLPDNLKDLAFRNSVEITHARWNSDVQLLTQALARYVAPEASGDTRPVHATVAVQLPPPTAPRSTPRSSRPTSVPLVLGVIAAVVLALGMVGWFIFHKPANPILGTWNNPTPMQGNSLIRLEVTSSSEQSVSIHAWGNCSAPGCDWGTQTVPFDGQQAKATWQFGGEGAQSARTAVMTIKPNHGQLSVTVENSYIDHAPSRVEYEFGKVQ
jgi:hypothetical protein